MSPCAAATRHERLVREVSSLRFSKVASFGIISTVGLSIFPSLLPSSIDPRSRLTVWGKLFTMRMGTVIFLPIVLADTDWVYRMPWGKVDEASVPRSRDSY